VATKATRISASTNDSVREPAKWRTYVTTIAERVKALLDDLSTDEAEERVLEYVIRELNNGRRLREVLHDPYVRNRLSAERIDNVMEHPEVVNALDEQIAASFKHRDFGFSD
jgi:predicted transcriptional regulator